MKIPVNVFGILLLTQTFLSQMAFGNPQDSLRPIPQVNKEFLVVVHVVKSDLKGNLGVDTTSIKNSIISINPKFAPIGVSFKICEIRLIDNLKFDTITNEHKEREELINLYHVPKRINIFYSNDIKTVTGKQICGDADLGGIADNSNAICIRKGCLGAILHEMGHYFSLMHTFEDQGVEKANGSNCKTAGDQVCDTPADPFNEDFPDLYKQDCKFIYEGKDTNGDYYDPHMSNIMSYYFCGCGEFTHGQYTKMANHYLSKNTIAW